MALGVGWDHAQPKTSKSNAIAEALVGSLCDAVRACNITAGLPACFWPITGPTVATLRNIWMHEDGESAHYQRFASWFIGLVIPVGALVWFRPSTSKYKLAKTMPRLQPGVFLGYELAHGCIFKGIYLVADLESFRGIHLNQATPARRFTHIVHTTRVVRIPDFDYWVFPLKRQYDFDNGVGDIAGLNAALYKGPPIPELDKIKKAVEEDKPIDDAGELPPAKLETDLSGLSYNIKRLRRGIVTYEMEEES